MIIDVAIDDSRWEEFGLQGLARKALEAVSLALGYQAVEFELSILGCDDARIAILNRDHRSKSAPTNVLSWPSLERGAATVGGQPSPVDLAEPELGDVAIAFETCMNEAELAGRDPNDHVMHLLIHGILHLFGYDHETDADAALMEALETEILAKMGISDPYEQRD